MESYYRESNLYISLRPLLMRALYYEYGLRCDIHRLDSFAYYCYSILGTDPEVTDP
jgi:hypothetical protein